MILFAYPAMAGNAAFLTIRPPRVARSLRVLRKIGAFAGPEDHDAVLVADMSWEDGLEPSQIVDRQALLNGVEYTYRIHYDGQDTYHERTCLIDSGYSDNEIDPIDLIVERMSLGLAEEVRRGKVPAIDGAIEVLVRPPSWTATNFPVVTVALESQQSFTRGVGDTIIGDNGQDILRDATGVYERARVSIEGRALNPSVRLLLHKSIKRVLLANLEIFEMLGLLVPEWTQAIQDELKGDADPVYISVTTFSFLAPAMVSVDWDDLVSIGVEGSAYG